MTSARMLCLHILSAMDACGFELVGSVDMSIGQSEDHRDCMRGVNLKLTKQWIRGSSRVRYDLRITNYLDNACCIAFFSSQMCTRQYGTWR